MGNGQLRTDLLSNVAAKEGGAFRLVAHRRPSERNVGSTHRQRDQKRHTNHDRCRCVTFLRSARRNRIAAKTRLQNRTALRRQASEVGGYEMEIGRRMPDLRSPIFNLPSPSSHLRTSSSQLLARDAGYFSAFTLVWKMAIQAPFSSFQTEPEL